MTLAADLSHLPRAAEGWAPDPEPRFVGLLAEKWAAEADQDKPTALGTRIRHSDAGKCARAIAYTAAGIPRSDPMDLTGIWNTTLGTLLHEAWQEALTERYGAEAEVEVKVGHDDLDASGHIDAVISLDPDADCSRCGGDRTEASSDAIPCDACGGSGREPGTIISYELKSIGGYGFKAAIGKARRGTPAEGPKPEHVAQAALNGLGVNADEVVVGYLAKEVVSVSMGAGMTDLARFSAEWTLSRAEYEPIALAEKERMAGILRLLEAGELAARKFPPGTLPPGAEITDPKTGRWEVVEDGKIADTGTWWACGYCSYRTVCATTEQGRLPLETVVEVTA